MKKAPGSDFSPTTVYFTDEMIDAIKERQTELQERYPGMRVTLSDVVRSAIQRGLKEVEGDE